MVVGLLEMDLYLPECSSLKEKRGILKSLKDRVRSRFNVSVAETDSNDLWQRAQLGVVVVANQSGSANAVLSRVVKFVQGEKRIQVLDFRLQFL